jgi:putative endonuclease
MARYYVYMLTNKWHTVLYTGSTNSIDGRLFQHKERVFVGFTKKYNCDQLVYFEEFSTRRTAEAREKQLKGWTRAKKNALIARMNPDWNDLLPLWQGVLRSAQD